ncbi:MAG: response regulator [Cyanobacteria bacterium]|nr:response regulator [Cyanobacteriota bacterium]
MASFIHRDSPPIVLVVDDNPTNLAVLTEALAGAGFDTAVATNGQDAIEQIRYEPPQLVLLDVMMPGINGFETCQRLKAMPATQDVPIIFMTALDDTAHKVRAFSLGAVDYVVKPLQQEEVLARVKVHLQVQHLTRTLEQQNQQLRSLTGQLETKVEQQTVQLNRAQVQLIQQEKLSMLGQLMAGVAHEINNPLSCLAGNIPPIQNYVADMAEILNLYQQQPGPMPAEIAAVVEAVDLPFILQDLPKLLTSMQVSTARIKEISQSLRRFARADADTPVPTDLHQGLESTLLILQHRLRGNGDRPTIAIHRDYGTLPLVTCYPGPINQVFMNVLANAIDAFDEGGGPDEPPEITIATRQSDPQFVEICITDNGPGIPPAVRDLLFDPQFTTKPVNKGTGLGLAISHQIVVDQHGGTLQCDSDPSGGATFTVTLPLVIQGIPTPQAPVHA